VADHPQLAQRLATYRGLVYQYRDFVGRVTEERDSRGHDAAYQVVVSTPEIPVTEMRMLLSDLMDESRGIIDARREQRFANARLMQRWIMLSLLMTIVGGFVVTLQVRNEVRRRGQSEAAVRETLREVDERVKQRTSELSLANQHLQEALDERAKALARERKARAAAERANQLKDQFLATVSHELRTPLNAIIGWTHVLKLGALQAAEVEHALSAIDRNAKAQSQLIADLLDVSRMMQGRLIFERVPTNLRQVVDIAVDKMRPAIEAKSLTLQYQPGDSDVQVLGDAVRLQQVVKNLLSNALKFTKAGQIQVELVADGAFAELRVRDTGEGIAPDMLPQVFEPFLQGRTEAKRTGLGLGLAIVRDLVGLHGGTVTARSEGPGTGALLIVRLPMMRVPAGRSASLRGDSHAVKSAGAVRKPSWWARLRRRKPSSRPD